MMTCRMCESESLQPLINFGSHPIAHRFVTDISAPEYTHPVDLFYCGRCGLVQLVDPIPREELYSNYTVLSSWKPEPHIPALIAQLSALPDLKKADLVIEVGSNDGVFLNALNEAGWENALGVEPANDAVQAAEQRGVKTIHGFFDPLLASELVRDHGRCKLLVARQVLEHITDLRSFSDAIQILLQPGGYILIEVPNAGMMLSAPDYSGVWEEHVNYFTIESLRYLLMQCQIETLRQQTTLFSGEILTVLGRYLGKDIALPKADYLRDLETKAFAYRNGWPLFRSALNRYLEQQRLNRGETIIYGAGCRACSLINFTGTGPHISFVIDDHAAKQGKLLPGSHLPIRGTEELDEASANLCLLAVNAENEAKVIAQHRSYQAAGGSFFSILPPSDRLLPVWTEIRQSVLAGT